MHEHDDAIQQLLQDAWVPLRTILDEHSHHLSDAMLKKIIGARELLAEVFCAIEDDENDESDV